MNLRSESLNSKNSIFYGVSKLDDKNRFNNKIYVHLYETKPLQTKYAHLSDIIKSQINGNLTADVLFDMTLR